MIKKFLLIIVIFSFCVSCGKKGPPEYKESKYKYINQNNIV